MAAFSATLLLVVAACIFRKACLRLKAPNAETGTMMSGKGDSGGRVNSKTR
jgi:hypothetical protein